MQFPAERGPPQTVDEPGSFPGKIEEPAAVGKVTGSYAVPEKLVVRVKCFGSGDAADVSDLWGDGGGGGACTESYSDMQLHPQSPFDHVNSLTFFNAEPDVNRIIQT